MESSISSFTLERRKSIIVIDVQSNNSINGMMNSMKNITNIK
jgi:hypothetical protein